MTWYKKYLITAFFTLLLTAGVFAVSNVQAQGTIDVGLNYAANIGLGTRDIRDTVGSIIKTLLGLLGIVGVSLVLYGGFRWMTSAGEAKNVEAAKKIIINAGVGTLIIISAYAITAFVFNQLGSSTTGGVGGVITAPAGTNQTQYNTFLSGCAEPTPTTSGPYICTVSPAQVAVGDYLTLRGGKFGAFDATTSRVFIYRNGYVGALNDAQCNGSAGCFRAEIASCDAAPSWGANQIIAEIPVLTEIGSYRVAVITANGDSSSRPTGKTIAPNDQVAFTGGTPKPGLACLTPLEGNVAEPVSAQGKRFGDTQDTSTLNFSVNKSATVSTWSDILLNSSVPAQSISGPVSVTVNSNKSNEINFLVSCQNNNQCGASGVGCCFANFCADVSYCAGTTQTTCTTTADCTGTQVCTAGVCTAPDLPTVGESCSTSTNSCEPGVCAAGSSCGSTCTCVADPVIYGFDPLDGETGTYLTIIGENFGEITGTVKFQKSGTTTFVDAGNVQCTDTDTWTDTEILVSIPSGFTAADLLSIQVTRKGDNATAVSSGNGFTVNALQRPGLCAVYKQSTTDTDQKISLALFGDPVLYQGSNLGTATVVPELLLTGASLEAVVPIVTGEIIKGSVPNINPGSYLAQVRIQTAPALAATATVPAKPATYVYSNAKTFTVDTPPVVPNLLRLDLTKGPKGQYVTVFGTDLGVRENFAKLILKIGAVEITSADAVNPGFFDFPAECSLSSTWTDGSITFKIPQSATEGAATVSIISSSKVQSNALSFTVCEANDTDCKLTPGICGIKPTSGRPGYEGLELIGEGFGAGSACADSDNCSVNFTPDPAAKINKVKDDTAWGILTSAVNWVNRRIGLSTASGPIVVPENATTGPVSVTVNGVTSNSINFTVADCTELSADFCSEVGTTCCAIGPKKGSCTEPTDCKPALNLPSNLFYTFNTGEGQEQPGVPMVRESVQCIKDIQSPSPFIDTTGNCVNAGLSASFVDNQGRPVQMEVSAFNPENIEVVACETTAVAFDNVNCITTTNLFSSTDSSVVDAVSNNAGFIINLPQELNTNTWYRVTLKSGATGLRSIYGLWLDGNRDGVGGGDYSWSFAVGNDPKACEVSKTLVTPEEALMTTLEDTVNYSALVMAVNCNLLKSSDFNWAWTSKLSNGNDGSGVAEITNATNPNRTVNVDWRQEAGPISQGVTYIGAQPYVSGSLNAADKLLVSDLNNRLAVDLKIPEIDHIEPTDGSTNPAVNNFVTIYGKNFGSDRGNSSVTFGDTSAELAQCGLPWMDNRIMVRVPTAQEIPADGVRTNLTTAEVAGLINVKKSSSVLGLNFDETGSLAKDSLSGAIATFSNDLGRTNSFLSGSSLLFNPDSENGLVQVHPSLSLPTDVIGGLAVGAFEVWIKPTDLSKNNIILNASSESDNFEIIIDGVKRAVKITGPNDYSLASPDFILEENKAYHLIWNVGVTTSQLYINGNLVASANVSKFFGSIADIEVINLGDYNDSTSHFVGEMDNLAVFNAPLTSSEVAERFGAISLANGISASLHFEDEGAEITDSSTNNLSIESVNAPVSAQGAFGNGYLFTSASAALTASKPQYLEIKGDNTLLFPNGISVGAWVKTSDVTKSQTLVSRLVGNYGFELSLGGDAKCPAKAACFKIGNEQGLFYAATGDLTNVTEVPAWNTNDWNWVLGTYDNRNISIYINGSLIDTYPDSEGNISPILTRYSYAPTCIGTNLLRGNNGALSCTPQSQPKCTIDGVETECPDAKQFIGTMDEVLITNYALSTSRIAELSGTVFDETGKAAVSVTTNRGVTVPTQPFNTSNLIHPFICEVKPNFGPKGIKVSLFGYNFGDSFVAGVGNTATVISNLLMGTTDLTQEFGDSGVPIKSWMNKIVSFVNPFGDIPVAKFPLKITIPFFGTEPSQTGPAVESNTADFYFKPVITSISPDKGPGQQWVTITGYNFGNYNVNVGGVFFDSSAGPIKAQLAPCGTSAWTNRQIVVEVPTDAVTGKVYVQSTNSNPLADLKSDPVNFTVTTDPVGAGLCPLDPDQIVPGQQTAVTGVRFGNIGDYTTPEAVIKVNGAANFMLTPLTWETQPVDLSIPMTITGKTDRSSLVSGKIQFVKDVVAGQECDGFRIGTFCPGGNYRDIIVTVPSNAVSVTALSGYSCTLGNPGTNAAKAEGWKNKSIDDVISGKTIFYYDQDGVTHDFQLFDVTNIISDGTYLYGRAWLDSSFDKYGKGVIAKISAGYDGKAPGELIAWYVLKDKSSGIASGDETSNFFLYNGKPAYVDFTGTLKVINFTETLIPAVNLPTIGATGVPPTGITPALAALAYEFTESLVVTPPAENENKFLSNNGTSYFATSYESTIINLVSTDTGYLIRKFKQNENTAPTALGADLSIVTAQQPIALEVGSIFASNRYLYVIGAGSSADQIDILDWTTATFVDRLSNLDKDTTNEVGGFYDPIHKEIYTAALSEGLQQSGRIYKYGDCAIVDTNSCTSDADCNLCGLGESSCINNKCTPVITKVTPNTAPLGSWVTVHGCYFGENRGSIFFASSTGTVEAPFPTEAICGNTWANDTVVIEVPKRPESFPFVPAENAISGKISLERGDLVRTSSPEIFNVGGDPLPQVCKLIPNEIDRLSLLTIKGRLGTYVPFVSPAVPSNGVVYRGTANDADDVAIAVNQASEWTENTVTTVVPPRLEGVKPAVSGGVDVKTQFNGQVLLSDNQLPLTIYETVYGPILFEGSPSISSKEYDTCRNAMAVLKFTEPLNPETIADAISIYSCKENATGENEASTMKKIWLAILDMFGHASNASLAETPKTCEQDNFIGSTKEYGVVDGVSQVMVSPSVLLAPEKRYGIFIAETLEGANGVHFNMQQSTRKDPVTGDDSPEVAIDKDPATGADFEPVSEVVFETQGEANNDNSGICLFTDIRTTVYNSQDPLYGKTQLGDAFFCAGEKCQMDIDYDQSTAKPNNQHKYVGAGLSEIVNPNGLNDFKDVFDGSSVNMNNYNVTNGCSFTASGGQVSLATNAACVLGLKSSAAYLGNRITVITDVMSTDDGIGLSIAGVNIYRSATGGSKRYVIEKDGTEVYSTLIKGGVSPITRWEAVYEAGTLTLKVNNIVIDTYNIAIDYTKLIGLYGNVLNATWGSLEVKAEAVNYLVADISWSRSDELDPQRLIGLSALDNPELKDLFKSRIGTVHAEPKPIKQAQTKIAVEVSSPYPGANVLSKQFPVTVFICQNPWITNPENRDVDFTSGAYNFVTKYCRDAGDPTDLFDDLPSADIVDASVIEAVNTASAAVTAAQQAVLGDLDTLEKLNNAQRLYAAAHILVDALPTVSSKTDLTEALDGKLKEDGTLDIAGVKQELQGATLYPDLALTVLAQTVNNRNTMTVNDMITFRAIAFNNGPADASGFTITVPLPTNVNYIDASSDSDCALTGTAVTCTKSALSVGVSSTLDIAFVGTEIAIKDFNFTLTSVGATDVNLGNNTRNLKVTFTASSNLEVVAVTAPNHDVITSYVSDLLDLSDLLNVPQSPWRVTNLGPSVANNILINFDVPAEIEKVNNATNYLTVSGVAGTIVNCKTVTSGAITKYQCTADKLAVGNYLSVVLNAKAKTSVVNPINLTITANGSEADVNPANNTDFNRLKIDPKADLSASLITTAGPYVAGNVLTLTAGVTNAGPSTTTPTISLNIPTTLTIDTANLTTQGCSVASNIVTCPSLGQLIDGATVKIDVLLTPNDIIPVSPASNITTNITSSVLDANLANNTGSVSISATKISDLVLSVTATPTNVNVGSEEVIIYKTINKGPSVVASTQLTINQISSFSITSIVPAGVCGSLTFPFTMSGALNCQLGALGLGTTGSSVTVKGKSILTSIPVGGTDVTSGGSVISTLGTSQGESKNSDNLATTTFKVIGSVDVTISGTATPSPIKVGQQGTYSLTISNASGLSDATNVVTTVTLPTGATSSTVTAPAGTTCTYPTQAIVCTTATLAKGTSIVIPALFRVTEAQLTDSTIGLSAAATSQQQDANSANNGTSATLTVSSISSSVVGAWNFDETGATVNAQVGGVNGTIYSLAGGTYQTAPSPQRSSDHNGAGSSLVTNLNNFLILPKGATVLNQTNSFTISFWYKTLATPTATQTIIDNSIPGSAGNRGGYIIEVGTDNRIRSGVSHDTSLTTTVTASTTQLQNNQWYHIGLVYDASGTRSLKLYINGVLENTASNAILIGYSSQNSGNPASFGVSYAVALNNNSINARPDNGNLDDVAILNRALTANEIQLLTTQ